MATVYLGRAIDGPNAGRLVAIKVMHRHIAMNPDFVMMFLDEARLASRIAHPNVVPMLDVDADDNGIFLVMDYVEGSNLHKILKTVHGSGGVLPFGVSLRIIIDALRGLHAAHKLKDPDGAPLNLVHRDVSPENILVGVDGRTRITDFGVAHAETRLAPTTQSGQVKGKYAFMSIEQMRNERVDARSDVYSAAVVLWELLAGRRLFQGDNDATVALTAAAGATEPPSAVNPEVPAVLDELVMKALQRFPEDRFEDAAAFADRIELASAQAGIHLFDVRELGKFLMQLDEEVPTAMAPRAMKEIAGRIRAEVAAEARNDSLRDSDPTHEEMTRQQAPSAELLGMPKATPSTDDDDDDEEVATVVRDALDPRDFDDSATTAPRGPLGTHMFPPPAGPVAAVQGRVPDVGIPLEESSSDTQSSETLDMSTRKMPSTRPPEGHRPPMETSRGAPRPAAGEPAAPREPAPTSPALLHAPIPAQAPVPKHSPAAAAAAAAEAEPVGAPVPPEASTASGAEVPRLVIPSEPRFKQINRIVIGVIGVMAVVTVVAVVFALRPGADVPEAAATSSPPPPPTAEPTVATTAEPTQVATGAVSAEPEPAPEDVADAGADEAEEPDAEAPDEPEPEPEPTVEEPPPPPPPPRVPPRRPPPPPPPPPSGAFRPDDL